jgi:hypothetical protein
MARRRVVRHLQERLVQVGVGSKQLPKTQELQSGEVLEAPLLPLIVESEYWTILGAKTGIFNVRALFCL